MRTQCRRNGVSAPKYKSNTCLITSWLSLAKIRMLCVRRQTAACHHGCMLHYRPGGHAQWACACSTANVSVGRILLRMLNVQSQSLATASWTACQHQSMPLAVLAQTQRQQSLVRSCCNCGLHSPRACDEMTGTGTCAAQ
jgi:hypothetical protein